MTFRKLVVADIVALHAQPAELGQHVADFLLSVYRVEFEREEYLRFDGVVVTIYELCYGAGMYDAV